MGLTAHPDGIEVRFLDENDQLESPALFGAKVELRGKARSVITATEVLTPAEEELPGSDDWLTLVAVADTDARLGGLLASFGPRGNAIPTTSAASHRVRIEVHTAAGRVTKTGRITLAEGDILSETPPRMQVRVLHVLAEGSVMAPGHPRHPEFVKVTPFSA